MFYSKIDEICIERMPSNVHRADDVVAPETLTRLSAQFFQRYVSFSKSPGTRARWARFVVGAEFEF